MCETCEEYITVDIANLFQIRDPDKTQWKTDMQGPGEGTSLPAQATLTFTSRLQE